MNLHSIVKSATSRSRSSLDRAGRFQRPGVVVTCVCGGKYRETLIGVRAHLIRVEGSSLRCPGGNSRPGDWYRMATADELQRFLDGPVDLYAEWDAEIAAHFDTEDGALEDGPGSP